MRLPSHLEIRVYKTLLESEDPLNTHEIVKKAKRQNKNKESERVQIIRILKRLVKDEYVVREDHGHANVTYYLTNNGKTFAEHRINWWTITQPKVASSLFCSTISVPLGHASVALPLNASATQKAEVEEKAKEVLGIMPSGSYIILRKG